MLCPFLAMFLTTIHKHVACNRDRAHLPRRWNILVPASGVLSTRVDASPNFFQGGCVVRWRYFLSDAVWQETIWKRAQSGNYLGAADNYQVDTALSRQAHCQPSASQPSALAPLVMVPKCLSRHSCRDIRKPRLLLHGVSLVLLPIDQLRLNVFFFVQFLKNQI